MRIGPIIICTGMLFAAQCGPGDPSLGPGPGTGTLALGKVWQGVQIENTPQGFALTELKTVLDLRDSENFSLTYRTKAEIKVKGTYTTQQNSVVFNIVESSSEAFGKAGTKRQMGFALQDTKLKLSDQKTEFLLADSNGQADVTVADDGALWGSWKCNEENARWKITLLNEKSYSIAFKDTASNFAFVTAGLIGDLSAGNPMSARVNFLVSNGQTWLLQIQRQDQSLTVIKTVANPPTRSSFTCEPASLFSAP